MASDGEAVGARFGERPSGHVPLRSGAEKVVVELGKSPANALLAAERLGVAIVRELGVGADGRVHLLADGRVLKVTASKVDAAVALALLERQAGGAPAMPSLPAVHAVAWFDPAPVALRARRRQRLGVTEDRAEGPEATFCIVRDEMADIAVPASLRAAWLDALLGFAAAWRNGNRRRIERIEAGWAPNGPEIRQIREGLSWLLSATGVTVVGLQKPENFGRTPAGAAGVRDMSRAYVPEALLRRVEARDFDRLP